MSVLRTDVSGLDIRFATPEDCPLIFEFICDLADYEKLSHEVVGNVEALRASLFGERPYAEVLVAHLHDEPAGMALFFHNYSTFLTAPGIYLEDLFVKPEKRGHGVGKELLTCLARIAVERDCGRLEWSVLDWNEPAIGFYKALGAEPMDEWTVFRLTGESLANLGSPAC